MANLLDTWSRQGKISSRFARESVKFSSAIYAISLFTLFYKIIDLQYDIGILKFYDDEILKFTGHGLRDNFSFEVKFSASLQNLIPKFRNFMK